MLPRAKGSPDEGGGETDGGGVAGTNDEIALGVCGTAGGRVGVVVLTAPEAAFLGERGGDAGWSEELLDS
jgi:hypothetical protein